MSRLEIELPDELVDQIADAVVQRLADRLHNDQADQDGFLDVAGAARYLACPKSRI